MVVDKTGGLFRLAVGLMQVFSEDKTDYSPLLNTLAYYFQVRDDFMNIMSTEYFANKSFCEDLTEGKFSFPIIHAIKKTPSDNRLLRILKQRTRDITVKQHAVQFMEKCGSLHYTWKKLQELYDEIVGLITGLGGHSVLMELIAALHNQITAIEDEAGADKGERREMLHWDRGVCLVRALRHHQQECLISLLMDPDLSPKTSIMLGRFSRAFHRFCAPDHVRASDRAVLERRTCSIRQIEQLQVETQRHFLFIFSRA